MFARRPYLAAGADDAVPWKSCRAFAHRRCNLPRVSADDATNVTVG